LVGVVSEEPLPKGNALLSNFFNSPLNQFNRNEWQVFVIGLERFKLLAVSDEGGYMYGSVEIVKDAKGQLSDKILDELRVKGIEYIKGSSTSNAFVLERIKGLQEE